MIAARSRRNDAPQDVEPRRRAASVPGVTTRLVLAVRAERQHHEKANHQITK